MINLSITEEDLAALRQMADQTYHPGEGLRLLARVLLNVITDIDQADDYERGSEE